MMEMLKEVFFIALPKFRFYTYCYTDVHRLVHTWKVDEISHFSIYSFLGTPPTKSKWKWTCKQYTYWMNIKSNYIIVTEIVMDTGPVGHYMFCMLQPIPKQKT